MSANISRRGEGNSGNRGVRGGRGGGETARWRAEMRAAAGAAAFKTMPLCTALEKLACAEGTAASRAVWKAPAFSAMQATKAPLAQRCAPPPFASACARPALFLLRAPMLRVAFDCACRRNVHVDMFCSYVLSEVVNNLLLPTLAALCRKVLSLCCCCCCCR